MAEVTFITNYLTHHQLPFAQEMRARLGNGFCMVVTNVMEEERIRMGWALDPAAYDFVISFDERMDEAKALVRDSDVLICGSTHVSYIQERLDAGKLTFRYFERLYKTGRIHAFTPKGYLNKWREHTRYRRAPVYLLCAGAYVPADFSLFFSYPGKMLKWGYFPEFRPAAERDLDRPRGECTEILWSGRMIGWKHAEDAVHAAGLLRDAGRIPFHLTMIGEGECREALMREIREAGLEEQIELLPFMKPDEVRQRMLASDIYLMSSNFEEGWGAVVNEAMNAGCAVVASAAAGSVPYLIKDGQNGLIYPWRKNGSERAGCIRAAVELLAGKEALRRQMGREAYKTVRDTWNAHIAAERFLAFCEAVLAGKNIDYADGPMSLAERITPAGGYAYCRERGAQCS
ncbi:MAG: glycosyltransferase [Lachnospiraceae bacterium]|nr:glycosyltransferase [Lachnospiraceae bacterium]